MTGLSATGLMPAIMTDTLILDDSLANDLPRREHAFHLLYSASAAQARRMPEFACQLRVSKVRVKIAPEGHCGPLGAL